MKEIGLMCGTFNPIHLGHLLVAELARNQYALDQVLFITAGKPPHRVEDLLDAESRHEMVESAIANNYFFKASRIELDRSGTSYTSDTLRALHSEFGKDVRLNLILGGDNIPYIKEWNNSDEIFKLCRLLVAYRTDGAASAQGNPRQRESQIPKAEVAPIDFPGVGISASLIRERLRAGKTVLYMVPEAVHNILLSKRHYLENTRQPGDHARKGKSKTPPGIPEAVTLKSARKWVRPLVSDKRFRHIEGVVEVAGFLSEKAGCDPFLALLAAWLHDACKEIKAKQLVTMAEQLAIPLGERERKQGNLLHGPVAAATVRFELGISNQTVLDAISEHTLGAVAMTKLSKVVFLSDKLEESRPEDYTDPIWHALDIDGSCDLDRAMLVACDLNLEYIIAAGKNIHPKTVEVRNEFLQLLKDG